MKDIVIPGKKLKLELNILAICIGVSYLLNIISIIAYKTEWIELVSQIHIVIAFGILIYILVALLRLVFTPIYRRVLKK